MYSFLFDIDDTVYDQLSPFRQAFTRNFARYSHVPLEELYMHSRKFSDEVFEQSEQGEMSREEMHIYRITEAYKMFDIVISSSAARQFQLDYEEQQQQISLLPDIVAALDYCKSLHFGLGIITNGPKEHQLGKIEQLRLNRWISPDHIFISGALGIAKPDKRIFVHAQELMGLDPDTTYYVGDSYENDILGAKQAGWGAIWINGRKRQPVVTDICPDYIIDAQGSIRDVIRSICRL
jgi:putative hydrolase of the HAD superfamily